LVTSASLGAMCHWALLAGARRAVAVETQPDFCVRARAMLQRAEATWPPLEGAAGSAGAAPMPPSSMRFEVVQMGVREFLAGCPDQSFDIVVAAGLLHCFTDPVSITLEMCRVARVALVLEVDHPEVYVNGVLSDGDHDSPVPAGGMPRANPASLARGAAPPPHTSEDAGLLQLAPSAMVNKSGADDSSYTGLAVVPSRALLERLVGALGFEPTRVRLKPHPTLNLDVHTYTHRRLHAALPKRFFLRCVKPAAALEAARVRAPVQSLEEAVVTGKGKIRSWHGALHDLNWWTFGTADAPDGDVGKISTRPEARVASGWENGASKLGIPIPNALQALGVQTSHSDDSQSAATMECIVGNWAFDHDVAQRFEKEAFCHIPDYDEVIEASINAIECAWVPSALGITGFKDEAKCELAKRTYGVIDVGCATGRTMLALLERGFAHVFGVDASADMLHACRRKLAAAGYTAAARDCLAHSPTFPPSSFFSRKEAGQGRGGIGGGGAGYPIRLGAVIANWTLHFITEPAERASYIQGIYNALVPGGCMVLTEKTRQDAATRSMYHAWKQRHPRTLSTQEVVEKSESLVGVLTPLPVDW